MYISLDKFLRIGDFCRRCVALIIAILFPVLHYFGFHTGFKIMATIWFAPLVVKYLWVAFTIWYCFWNYTYEFHLKPSAVVRIIICLLMAAFFLITIIMLWKEGSFVIFGANIDSIRLCGFAFIIDIARMVTTNDLDKERNVPKPQRPTLSRLEW